ncbi:MAG: ROK family protein [Candidatus Baltobacteraceae bacterium]
MNTIGIDLGGTHAMAALVDESGKIVAHQEQDIEDRTFEAVLKTIVTVVRGVLAGAGEKKVPAVGLGSPGNIDLASGAVRYSPNFGWTDVPLGARLGAEFGVTVHVGNDARCATLGEHTFGSGQGTKDFVMLTLGTGIGGGIVADGMLVLGHGAGAGEIGHHQIRAVDGFICGCGKTGCFEAQASGTGLLRHAFAVAPSFPRSTLLTQKPPDKLGTKAVRKAAEAGDPHALAAWRRYVEDLACGLANIIAFVNPETIALGGGLSSAGDFMLAAVRPRVEELTTMAPRGQTKIVTAVLGNDAGAIGAAVMARRGGLGATAT